MSVSHPLRATSRRRCRLSSRGCFTRWVTPLSQETALQAIINHGDKQPSHFQVSTGTDESFIKAPISHSFLFSKPFISWDSKWEQIIFFHLRLPALVYLRSHRGGVLSNYTNIILFTGGKVFILPENSFLRTYILKKKKNNKKHRKNIFSNLVLPGVTELFLCYISLSQKWMELKTRLEVAERGFVWGMVVPWPNKVSVCYVPLWQIPLFQLWLGMGCSPKFVVEEKCENWGHCRKIIPFSHTTAFLSRVPDRIYQGKTIYLILREKNTFKEQQWKF